MNPDQHRSSEKPRKQKYRTTADHGKGLLLGDDGTQINHFHQPGKTPVVVVGVVVLVVAAIAGAALWATRNGGDSPNSAGVTTTSEAVPIAAPGPVPPTTTAARTTAPAPIWYDLTRLRAVVWNNGFDPIDPVRIGAASFPAGIVGGYQSSATDQNNKAVWAIGGKCTRFEAAVGKNTDSSGGGTGRFVVIGDERELFSAEVGPNDPPTEIQIDITGVIRLTLYDTRRLSDATNAWGRPRVSCATSPGPAR
ncbi:NPCBM/NEW2 domain-containing protein [Nocardia sp. NPDC048505]|uniref:NPCBM/NEW2 domain-containing protein n=1 Tax=unclassified Nocardia TaxID=2637762 RepID=UPI0033C3E843